MFIKDFIKNITIKKMLMFFLAISPIFDTTFFYSRITTLVRISIITILFLFVIFKKIHKKEKLFWLLIYVSLIISYLCINYFRSKNFISYVPDNFNYNFLSELLTVWKLFTPIMLIYIISYYKFTKNDFFKVINCWVLLIAGSIIISNVFKLSLASYSDGVIKKSIFHWTKLISYKYTASKGMFVYANQEALIMIILLALSLYEFFCLNKKYFVNIVLLIVSMLMLGTRISTLGGFIILIVTTINYLLFCLIKKEKLKKNSILICLPLIVWALLLPISPYSNRNLELNRPVDIKVEGSTLFIGESNTPSRSMTKKEYVYSNYNKDYLPKVFFEDYYPIEYDPDFWYNFVKNNPVNKINYRMIEENIIKRVWNIDHKKGNMLFGISNSRIQNIVNIESDFKLHYYAFGIIGSVILLLPYLMTLIMGIINFIKNRNLLSMVLAWLCVVYIVAAYLSGNIINSMTTIIAFSLIAGMIYQDKNISQTPNKG